MELDPSDFETITTKYGLTRGQSTQYTGCIDGENQYTQFIDDMHSIGIAFFIRDSKQSYNDDSIYFQLTSQKADVPYSGRPFHLIKTQYMICVQGGQYKQELSKSDGPTLKKRRLQTKPTKKTECPAKMTVKCLLVYTEDRYKAKAPQYKHGAWELKKIIHQLKKDLRTASPPTGMLRFIISMSSPEEHNHTTDSTKLNGMIHTQLKEEIYTLVDKDLNCSTKTVKAHLEEVVQHMFEDGDRPKPDRMNRCYYPNDQVIRFHMQRAFCNVKKGKCNEDELEASIETWQTEFPDDKFYLRPYKVETNNEGDEESTCSTLLFCHQTKWQCDLLARYGNDISLLDGTFKTKYDQPLFFIVVKTNSGYNIVGTFVVQIESNVLISEALAQFKAWNPDWEPKYFMTDYSEAEINALEDTFPESKVYLCTFHREQAWHKWLTKKGNVLKTAIDPLKKLWQNIAASRTEEDYMENLNTMYNDENYILNINAQRYFTREWLPVHCRWVSAYHAKDFLSKVNTNNGIESQNEMLKHSYFKHTQDNTLTGMIRTIVKFFLPDALLKYCLFNAMADNDYKMNNADLPDFVKNRPMTFIEHIKVRYENGKKYDSSQISDMENGLFLVKSDLHSPEWCRVDFHEATCVCGDFSKWHLPCKHMCAIFINTEWGFDKLPVSYQQNPYLTLDTNYITEIASGDEETSTLIDDAWQMIETHDEDDNGNNHDHPSEEEANAITINRKKELSDLIRENLKILTEYTYLDYTVEDLEHFLNMTKQLMESMRSKAPASNEALLDSREKSPSRGTKTQQVKNIKQKYIDLPKCLQGKKNNIKETSQRKKNSKYVVGAAVEADGWRQIGTNYVDVTPTATVIWYK